MSAEEVFLEMLSMSISCIQREFCGKFTTMRVGLGRFLCFCTIACSGWPLSAQINSIAGVDRSPSTDVLTFRTGERVSGRAILQEPIRIALSYAGDVEFRRTDVAALLMNENNELTTIIAESGNRFSGVLLSTSFEFAVGNLPPSQISRGTVQSLVLRMPPQSVSDATSDLQAFLMANGDRLRGNLVGETTVITNFGTIDIDGITHISVESDGTTIRILTSDGTSLGAEIKPNQQAIRVLPLQLAPEISDFRILSLLPDSGPPSATPLAVGVEFEGTIDPDRGISLGESARSGNPYWFVANAGEIATIEMVASFDSYLDLYRWDERDNEYTYVDSDDDGISSGSRIRYRLESSGTYVVLATAYSSSTTGDYSLTLQLDN